MNNTEAITRHLLNLSVQTIDDTFGDGYAIRNPKFVADVALIALDVALAKEVKL